MTRYEQDIANESKFLELLSNCFSRLEKNEVVSLSYFGMNLKVTLVLNGEWHQSEVMKEIFSKFKHRFRVTRTIDKDVYESFIICSAPALAQTIRKSYAECAELCQNYPYEVTATDIESLEEMHSILKTLIGFSTQIKTE